ncbi:hypothetical protein AVEN_176957-1 [Araneus ventricosus]|uniref:Transposase Tc1-like domain-containing protein n=1 Tax=Araneus ventricosus TaxID=182803 RepID=A0A4Y2T192_ARAVE|nr:hypothetical protein AVEN_176957-1 [Araneus ventricosus]
MTVREVQRSSGLSVSKDIIRKRILETRTMVHAQMKKKPALKSHHKNVVDSKSYVIWTKWQSVIFSDKKSGFWMVQMAGHCTDMT